MTTLEIGATPADFKVKFPPTNPQLLSGLVHYKKLNLFYSKYVMILTYLYPLKGIKGARYEIGYYTFVYYCHRDLGQCYKTFTVVSYDFS